MPPKRKKKVVKVVTVNSVVQSIGSHFMKKLILDKDVLKALTAVNSRSLSINDRQQQQQQVMVQSEQTDGDASGMFKALFQKKMFKTLKDEESSIQITNNESNIAMSISGNNLEDEDQNEMCTYETVEEDLRNTMVDSHNNHLDPLQDSLMNSIMLTSGKDLRNSCINTPSKVELSMHQEKHQMHIAQSFVDVSILNSDQKLNDQEELVAMYRQQQIEEEAQNEAICQQVKDFICKQQALLEEQADHVDDILLSQKDRTQNLQELRNIRQQLSEPSITDLVRDLFSGHDDFLQYQFQPQIDLLLKEHSELLSEIQKHELNFQMEIDLQKKQDILVKNIEQGCAIIERFTLKIAFEELMEAKYLDEQIDDDYMLTSELQMDDFQDIQYIEEEEKMNFNTEIKNGGNQEWSEIDGGSTYRGGLDTGRDTGRDTNRDKKSSEFPLFSQRNDYLDAVSLSNLDEEEPLSQLDAHDINNEQENAQSPNNYEQNNEQPQQYKEEMVSELEPVYEMEEEDLTTEQDVVEPLLVRKLSPRHVDLPTRLETVKEVYEEEIVSPVKKMNFLKTQHTSIKPEKEEKSSDAKLMEMRETRQSLEKKTSKKGDEGSNMPIIIFGVGIAVAALFVGYKLAKR